MLFGDDEREISKELIDERSKNNICPMTNQPCIPHTGDRRRVYLSDEDMRELVRLAAMSKTTRSTWALLIKVSSIIATVIGLYKIFENK